MTATVEEIIARAMQESKAWPAVYNAGSALTLARAAVAALDAASFVIVPKEPTAEMTEAGWPMAFDKNGPENVNAVYRAMIKSRPQSPSGGEGR